MESLKSMTAKLGAPKLEGSEAVGGKDAPACISAQPRSTTTSTLLTRLEKRTALYVTGCEPIKDSSGAQIGVFYVGYKK